MSSKCVSLVGAKELILRAARYKRNISCSIHGTYMRDLAVRRMDALAFRRMIRLAFHNVEKEKIKSNHALAFRHMIALVFRRIEKQKKTNK